MFEVWTENPFKWTVIHFFRNFKVKGEVYPTTSPPFVFLFLCLCVSRSTKGPRHSLSLIYAKLYSSPSLSKWTSVTLPGGVPPTTNGMIPKIWDKKSVTLQTIRYQIVEGTQNPWQVCLHQSTLVSFLIVFPLNFSIPLLGPVFSTLELNFFATSTPLSTYNFVNYST